MTSLLSAPPNASCGAPPFSARWDRPQPPHILFASVFGPYGQDDEFGSRSINPMELYHNQVTRVQGPFSLRMFHRSWGLMLLRENIQAPSALLDFPTRERFVEELQTVGYDIVALSAIPPNYLKVAEMCRLIRQYQPAAEIIIGGHIAGLPDLQERVGADHVVRGEGIRWLRRYLGEDEDAPIRHPHILSGFGARTMGQSLGDNPARTAATVIPSVGCPMGCNFCATSAAFGGKGKFVNFYETGDELYGIMAGLEREMGVQSFFVMDENFLLHRKRALRLLELMREGGKSWSLYVFSSANVLRSYSMEQLVELGISWVWMGLEGENSDYQKLAGADTRALVQELREHGISVLGSTIIGLEEHTRDNLPAAIDYAVSHATEFHQFMLYTPVPGTPLFREHQENGTLLDPECHDTADAHGQLRFVHRHPHLLPGEETAFLQQAFEQDFVRNGPSVLRLARTTLRGWKRYAQSSDARVRARFVREGSSLATSHAAAVAGAALWFKNDSARVAQLRELQKELIQTFGWKARLSALFGGWFVYFGLRREARRLALRLPVEPSTFYEPLPETKGLASLAREEKQLQAC
jgi:radical SAM superfamily enzyme YgiQ (UPF0313 family)